LDRNGNFFSFDTADLSSNVSRTIPHTQIFNLLPKKLIKLTFLKLLLIRMGATKNDVSLKLQGGKI
jgi:hypothetical protein